MFPQRVIQAPDSSANLLYRLPARCKDQDLVESSFDTLANIFFHIRSPGLNLNRQLLTISFRNQVDCLAASDRLLCFNLVAEPVLHPSKTGQPTWV